MVRSPAMLITSRTGAHGAARSASATIFLRISLLVKAENPPADPSQPKFSAAISALAAEISARKAKFPVRNLRKQVMNLESRLLERFYVSPCNASRFRTDDLLSMVLDRRRISGDACLQRRSLRLL